MPRTTTPAEALAASFRDPAGFLFSRHGLLYRQINELGAPDYSKLMSSGLYDALTQRNLLVRHEEVNEPPADSDRSFRVIRPERLPFVSYPYEWCFSQLKDAALAMLRIQRIALRHGMCLKDASAFNIQYLGSRPMHIDTLSFEAYEPGQPWVAYRQFCRHFLAPLALMAYREVRLGYLMRLHIDGVPLDLASRLLPARTRLRPSLLVHLHLHAAAERRFAGRATPSRASMSEQALLALVQSLTSAVEALRWNPAGTPWSAYDPAGSYSPVAAQEKKRVVSAWIGDVRPATVWDLGANAGDFSMIALEAGAGFVVSFDMDHGAVERHYRDIKGRGVMATLPLVMDLTNPSPGTGWAHRERSSLVERGPADMALALALVHHLAIANNVPLTSLAEFLAGLARRQIIEFIPKSDPQVQRLLLARRDIFGAYTVDGFEAAFQSRFRIIQRVDLEGSERSLYLLESLADPAYAG